MGGGCPMSVKGVTGNPLFSFRGDNKLAVDVGRVGGNSERFTNRSIVFSVSLGN